MGNSTTNSTYPVAIITNSLSFDLDIYDVFNATGDPNALYTYTLLDTVSANTTKNVATKRAASHLLATRTGAIDALNSLFYQNFPVSAMGIQVFDGDFKSFTIDSDDQVSMEQSFQFIKYITANPDSQIAKDFVTALSDTDNQDDTVNTYFKNTGSFKSCTIDSWTNVMAWQTQYLSAWQGPYYLYSVVSGTVSDTNQPELIATVSIVSNNSNSNATLTLSNVSGLSQLQMVGDGTMQNTNPKTNTVTALLTPVWLNVAQNGKDQNGNVVTTYVIGSNLSGTVMGTQVIGTQTPVEPLSSSASSSSLSTSQKLQLAQTIINDIFSLVGTLISGGMLFIMIKQYKQEGAQKKLDVENNAAENPPVNQDEVRGAEAQIDQQTRENLSGQDVRNARGDQEAASQAAEPSYTSVENANRTVNATEGINTAGADIGQALERGPATQDIEDEEGELIDARSSVTDGDTDAATAKVADVTQKIDATLKTENSNLEKVQKDYLSKSEAAGNEEVQNDNAEKEAQTEHEQEVTENSAEPINSNEESKPVEDPI
jgi:hypothetical protein